MEPAIIVHGGAWAIPEKYSKTSIEGVEMAVQSGYDILSNGGNALDAVENAVISLEDNPVFDAGKGSVLTADQTIEMDAIIIDGDTLNFGAVAGISNFTHPVSIARTILERSDHVFFTGEGAERFAADSGLSMIDPTILITEEAIEEFRKFNNYNEGVAKNFKGHDTVGAVAIDSMGKIAVATSTGGITGKRVGRVGDSPIIGSGAVADSHIGGVSTTGHGESILKVQLAKSVLVNIERGYDVITACQDAVEMMRIRVGGSGGVIAIDSRGNIAKAFSTSRMVWSKIDSGGMKSGIDG